MCIVKFSETGPYNMRFGPWKVLEKVIRFDGPKYVETLSI